MSANILALPIVLPLFTGALLLLIPTTSLRTVIAVASTAITLTFSWLIAATVVRGEVLSVQMSAWPAPYGITVVADSLTGVMLVLSSSVGLLTVLFLGTSLQHAPRRGSSNRLNRAREQFGAQALLQFLFMGVHMSFLTGDLFNLFVAFEVMLIASYGLVLLGSEVRQLREGLKYVVINLLASAVFVTTAGFAYGLLGTLNMADMAVKIQAHTLEAGPDARISLLALLFGLVFATKAALFPLGFWLPAAYPTPPAALSAFFAALLTKVGAYTLIRSFTLIFPAEQLIRNGLFVLAAATILMGALGAINQRRWRYLLAFANLASIGYLIMGVMTQSEAGLGAAIFYMANSTTVMFALFLIAAIAERLTGESYYYPGHLNSYPFLSIGFFVCALALAGLPPTSGFVGKFALIEALYERGDPLSTAIAIVALAGSLLLLYALMTIWRNFFWGNSDAVHREPLPLGMVITCGAASALVLVLTLVSGPAFEVATLTAEQLRNPEAYIEQVLSPQPDSRTALLE
ncbi:MAG: proton-conducting transporter membrane subunit [Deinococcota bacterium]